MQAVILVGGQGTRLRPLTSTVPKPVVHARGPAVHRLHARVAARARHRRRDHVLRVPRRQRAQRARRRLASLGIRLRFVEEPEPRGTAGALKLAEPMLDERFLMLNGDVLTDIDLTAQIAQHEQTGRPGDARAGRRSPTRPPTASCSSTRTARCAEFVEKPSSDRIDTNLISAGAYVLERDVLELVPPDRNVSIEREVWPRLVGDGPLRVPSDDATGWTSARPSATCRAPSTSSRATSTTAVRERLGGDWLASTTARASHGRVIPPAVLGARCGRRRGRARRQPRRARRGRLDRRRQHRRARGAPRRRRGSARLRAARLHRRAAAAASARAAR